MPLFKCQPCFPVRVALLSLVICATGFSAYGQTTYKGNLVTIMGEDVSPQLTGQVLRVLFDGTADLYVRNENNTSYYYITDRGGRLFTLTVPSNVRTGKKDQTDSWRQGVVSVLKVVMQDAPSLFGRIESVSPDMYDLTELMREYHVATAKPDEIIIYEAPPRAFVPHAGLFVAWNEDFLKPRKSDELEGFAIDPAFYPTAGITLKTFLPRINQNFSVTLDVSFGKRYFYGFYSGNTGSPQSYLYQEVHMHNYLIMADMIAGYSFGHGRIRPSISGGICSRAVISDSSRMDIDQFFGSMVISGSYLYITKEKYSLGIILSPGLSIDFPSKLSITASISYSDLFISDAPGSYRSISMKLGITL